MVTLLLGCGPDPKDSVSATETAAWDDTGDTDTGVETDTDIDTGDRDRDGVRWDAGDCDDDDSRVYPGAEDPCDAVDQDCDGAAWGVGDCGELVPLELGSVGAWVGPDPANFLALFEADVDYTGDGIVDIVAVAENLEVTSGSYVDFLLIPGAVPEGSQVVPVSGGSVWLPESRDWLVEAGNAGDFDGDGSRDLYVISSGCEPDYGAVYLMPGPAGSWPEGGGTTHERAGGWWEQMEDGDCFAQGGSGGYDVTGDGLDDLVFGYPAEMNIVVGRSAPVASGTPIHDETWFEGNYVAATLVPDLDGDGVGDLLFGYAKSPGYAAAFLPTQLLADGAAGLALEDVAEVVEHPAYNKLDLLEGDAALGDVNGDGLEDVAVGAFRDVTGDGNLDTCAAILTGATGLRTASSLDDHLTGLVCVDDAERSSLHDWNRVGGDIDRDGHPDLLLGRPYLSPDDDYLGCVVPSSRRPSAGWENLRDVRPYCFGIGDEPRNQGAAVDLDGDGLPELIGSDTSYASARGRILVAPGFEVPFGDDEMW